MSSAAIEESTAGGQMAVALFASSAGEMAALEPCAALLEKFGVSRQETVIEAADCRLLELPAGLRAAIVASPDGALPAALAAAWGKKLPVIRVPAPATGGLEALTDGSAGDGYATVALGEAGARNAALLVVAILALNDPRLREAWHAFRQEQTRAVLNQAPLA